MANSNGENLVIGREPVTIVEIYQQSCINTYGIAPCLANKPAGQECYNTKKTCQDTANYDGSKTIVWRFIKPTDKIDDLFEVVGDEIKTFALPCLGATSASPTIINVGGAGQNTGALGKRAVFTAAFTDFPYNDQFSDEYVIARSYNPETQGTFWGKFLARNPYYQNSRVVVYDGYKGQALSDMVKREYLLDKINIGKGGAVSLTARDPLRLADDKRALAPPASGLELFNAPTAVSTVIQIKNEGGAGDKLDPIGTSAKQYLTIDSEIISYDGFVDNTTHLTLSSVVRGEFNTISQAYSVADKAQRMLRYEGTQPQRVVNDLLLNYTSLDNTGNQYWDLAVWDAEYNDYLSGLTFTGSAAEPTAVDKFLAILCEQGNFYIWWNDRTAKIEFKTIRPSDAIPTLLSDDINLMSDVTVKTMPQDRYSRAVVYYGQRNPMLKATDISNYASVFIRIDTESEETSEYGESRTKNIYANFLPDDSFVTTLATTFVQRYRDNPQFMTINVDAKDGSLWTGAIVDVNTRNVQNADGSDATGRWQIISAKEIESGSTLEYTLQNFVFVGKFGSWMADGALDYLDTSLDNRANGAWYCDENGNMSNGDSGYKYQ